MTDTEPRDAAHVPGSGNSDWGHPGREHAAEEQSATAPSGWAHPADADPQRRAGSHQGSADPADDLTGNTSGDPGGDDDGDDGAVGDGGDGGDGAPYPGDTIPGDGSVGRALPPDVDAVRTAETGRETEAARADTSDSTPTPRETTAG
jgi:hypothetical protein